MVLGMSCWVACCAPHLVETQLRVSGDGLSRRRYVGAYSKTNYIAQSPRLAQAVADALTLHSADSDNPWLVPGKGGKLLKATVDTAMQRLKRQMTDKKLTSIHTYSNGKENVEKPLFWTLHDLKRKGIGDADDTRIGGHRSASMRDRYDTKVEVFEAPR